MNGPRRIVCLSDEPTETLYALGEQDRIVGISGFTVRPAQAREEKPAVTSFTHARIDRILELKPDMAIGFSDLQADIAAELAQHGVEVWVANHRSIAGILQYILRLGALVGASEKAQALVDSLQAGLDEIALAAAALEVSPRVYIEEWDEPLICGIGWFSELVELAGGTDVFTDRAWQPLAKARIIADPGEVIAQAPEIMLASWCGKRFDAERVYQRPGWQALPAVRDGMVFGLPSSIVLQPGPAALTDGAKVIAAVIQRWTQQRR